MAVRGDGGVEGIQRQCHDGKAEADGDGNGYEPRAEKEPSIEWLFRCQKRELNPARMAQR